jgi:hypothetical protein
MAAGDADYPCFVSSDSSATRIFEPGVRDGIDLKVEIASLACATQSIFEKYVDQVLVPTVESNRWLPGCAKKPALLFCDNCAAYCSEEILSKLAQYGIIVITYPLIPRIFSKDWMFCYSES